MSRILKNYEISVWKDRPGRTRVVIKTKDGIVEARRYFYSRKHKDYDIDGYRILQLDMNPFNFNKTNLVKVTPLEMNLLLNNNLLTKTDDYAFNKKRNKVALELVKNIIITKKAHKEVKNRV